VNGGGQTSCFRFKSSKAEIAFLAQFLSQFVDQLPDNPRPKDGAVCLFPSWRVLNFYFDQLSPQLPCQKRKSAPSGARLWLQRVLQLVCRPGQRFLERLILEEYEAVKPSHKRKMVKLILQRDIPPADALDILIANGVLTGLAASQANAFCELCHGLASRDPALIAQQIAGPLHANVQQLGKRLESLLLLCGEPEQEDATDRLCDDLIPDSAQPPEDPRAILFLTMHGSKGLTKHTVAMPGLEEAWLPGKAQDSDPAEQRRLFYVALTRATDRVLITFPGRRGKGDPLNYDTPGLGESCSFVGCAGIECSYHA